MRLLSLPALLRYLVLRLLVTLGQVCGEAQVQPEDLHPTFIHHHSPILQIHLYDLPKALEETLHIPLSGPVAEAPDIHPR